ncbi:MAG: hypothetical protein M0Z82_05610 [Actinomycetota bacterium]|nr:hypothetical protein [Actinomycetota bacterium]
MVSVSGAIGICQIEPSTVIFVHCVVEPRQSRDVYTVTGNVGGALPASVGHVVQ